MKPYVFSSMTIVEGMASICIPLDQDFAIGYLYVHDVLYQLQFRESFGPSLHDCIPSPSRFWNCTIKAKGQVQAQIDDIQQPRSDGDVLELDTEWNGDVVGRREGPCLRFIPQTVQVGKDAERVVAHMFTKLTGFETIITTGTMSVELDPNLHVP
jgi:hypothetical protein